MGKKWDAFRLREGKCVVGLERKSKNHFYAHMVSSAIVTSRMFGAGKKREFTDKEKKKR